MERLEMDKQVTVRNYETGAQISSAKVAIKIITPNPTNVRTGLNLMDEMWYYAFTDANGAAEGFRDNQGNAIPDVGTVNITGATASGFQDFYGNGFISMVEMHPFPSAPAPTPSPPSPEPTPTPEPQPNPIEQPPNWSPPQAPQPTEQPSPNLPSPSEPQAGGNQPPQPTRIARKLYLKGNVVLSVPSAVIKLLWRCRQAVISKEVHGKLHPLI